MPVLLQLPQAKWWRKQSLLLLLRSSTSFKQHDSCCCSVFGLYEDPSLTTSKSCLCMHVIGAQDIPKQEVPPAILENLNVSVINAGN